MLKRIVQQIAQQEQIPSKELEDMILGIEDKLEYGLAHPELFSYVMLNNLFTFKPTKKLFHFLIYAAKGQERVNLLNAYEKRYPNCQGFRGKQFPRPKSAKKLLRNRTSKVGHLRSTNRFESQELLADEREEN